MKLINYMADNGISPAKLADLVKDVTESGVRKWMYGERVPRPDQLRKIAEVTDGAVMPNDFIIPEAEATPQETAA